VKYENVNEKANENENKDKDNFKDEKNEEKIFKIKALNYDDIYNEKDDSFYIEKRKIIISETPEKTNVADFLEREDYDELCLLLRSITAFKYRFDFTIFLPSSVENINKENDKNNQYHYKTTLNYYQNKLNTVNYINKNTNINTNTNTSSNTNTNILIGNNYNIDSINYLNEDDSKITISNRLNTNSNTKNLRKYIRSSISIDDSNKFSETQIQSELDKEKIDISRRKFSKTRFKINYETNIDTISSIKNEKENNLNYINKKYIDSKINFSIKKDGKNDKEKEKQKEILIHNFNKTDTNSIFSIITKTNTRENEDTKYNSNYNFNFKSIPKLNTLMESNILTNTKSYMNSINEKKFSKNFNSIDKFNYNNNETYNDNNNNNYNNRNLNLNLNKLTEKINCHNDNKFSFLNILDGKMKYILLILEKYTKINNIDMFKKLDTIEYYKIVINKRINNENILKYE
jgi:hypothetical protein